MSEGILRLGSVVNAMLRYAGLEVRAAGRQPRSQSPKFVDVDPWIADIIDKVRPFTMTSEERISALCHAVKYILRSSIPGDIVECGVWRGGSMMAAAIALLALGDNSRVLHLFDTFEGMPAPTEIDRAADSGIPASVLLQEADPSSDVRAYSPIEDVRANLVSTGYPVSRLRFVKGPVEHTIPREAPREISILRLDTDWYESTRHELVHLYPRIVSGGVLIIDDYGHWEGARKAVDEYLSEYNVPILLNRIDYTGRIAVKIAAR
jgi:O-methyltransferase